MKAAGLCTYKCNDFSQYEYSKLHCNGPKICCTIISMAKTNIFLKFCNIHFFTIIKSLYIYKYFFSRFHRAAFIFIGNMALADFVLVIVETVVVQIELNTKDQIRQTLYNSHEDFFEEITEEETKLVKLDQRILWNCR